MVEVSPVCQMPLYLQVGGACRVQTGLTQTLKLSDLGFQLDGSKRHQWCIPSRPRWTRSDRLDHRVLAQCTLKRKMDFPGEGTHTMGVLPSVQHEKKLLFAGFAGPLSLVPARINAWIVRTVHSSPFCCRQSRISMTRAPITHQRRRTRKRCTFGKQMEEGTISHE